jgi:hypothetical protein
MKREEKITMPYTSISMYNKTLYVRTIKVSENMEIEVLYKDKNFNYADEVYKITVNPTGIKRELIGDEIYWTSYNNKNNSDSFLVLKDGVVVKEEIEEEQEEEEEEEEDEEEEEEEEEDEKEEQDEDYNSDTTEVAYSSDEEEKPRCKRTTGFLVFASENKKDKTDLSIMNLGPCSKVDFDLMTQLGEMWKDLSEEDHTNYAIKAQLINNHYAECMNVELD